MVEYIDINNARLAYRLKGPPNAPLIITLHGGRGFGKCHFSAKYDKKNLTADRRPYFWFPSLLSSIGSVSRFVLWLSRSWSQLPNQAIYLCANRGGYRRHFAGPTVPCIICGGSFGGFLAQRYAIKYPSHVSHLILRGTAPSYHRESDSI